MKVTTLPAIGPRISSNVKMSVSTWHGCSSSVSALIVGILENSANVSTSLCAKVRMTAPCAMRPRTRAVSWIGSPRPSWMSFALRNSALPPSSRMPTSNETRVRVDDFENISAHVWPLSGCVLCAPRSFLKTFASRKMVSKSLRGNFSNDNRCFMCSILLEILVQRKLYNQNQTPRHSQSDARTFSPSPLRGERAGVRGGIISDAFKSFVSRLK